MKSETLSIHAGQTPDPVTGSRALPIYQTTAYSFKDSDHAARLFALEESGNIYTRLTNPTTEVFENRMTALEGGTGAVAFASGHAAIAGTFLNFLQTGDEIASSSSLYGGTFNLLQHTLPRLGINTRFFDARDPASLEKTITGSTKAVFAEMLGNPQINVLDIEAAASIAHAHGLPLIIDNTFLTPYLFRPFAYGADLIVHSATKFIGGHGTSMGGVVTEGGSFDWNNGKFPLLASPDPSYHGLNYAADLGAKAFSTRLRTQILRDYGACVSPFNSFLLLQGLETLHLRMARHSENALSAARFLSEHEQVAWVSHPGLPSHPDHAKAAKYLTRGAGAVFTFGIKGGLVAGKKFIDSLRLFSLLANIGDAKSLVIHPASTTHSQLSSEQRSRSGVPDDLIRLSVGLEHIDDILEDLAQALAASGKLD